MFRLGPNANIATLFAVFLSGLAISLAVPVAAQDEEVAAPPNEVCGPVVSAGRFNLTQIGPKIAGTWQGTAPGMGFTAGVNHFSVSISYENGRVYLSGEGMKVELKPVFGERMPLRYDARQQHTIPVSARAIEVTPEDVGLVANCEIGLAPQFTWEIRRGNKSSGGVYSFFEKNIALGTMWNSDGGAREVLLER